MILGVQFITMGLIGEMLSRVYHESQKKPTYVIKEMAGKLNSHPSPRAAAAGPATSHWS
jgi:hypothetical protein